jgi:hypothetical protein
MFLDFQNHDEIYAFFIFWLGNSFGYFLKILALFPSGHPAQG